MDDFCELAHLGGCGGPLEEAHVINKSRLRNVDGAMKYIDRHPDVLLAAVCHNHNTGRDHDTKANRAYLLQLRVEEFGYDYVAGVLEGLRKLFKVPPADLRLEALLEGLPT